MNCPVPGSGIPAETKGDFYLHFKVAPGMPCRLFSDGGFTVLGHPPKL